MTKRDIKIIAYQADLAAYQALWIERTPKWIKTGRMTRLSTATRADWFVCLTATAIIALAVML